MCSTILGETTCSCFDCYVATGDFDFDMTVDGNPYTDELVISEANDAKTIAKYSLGNGILTIISNQEETAEYFAANTVIVYKKK